LTHLPRVFLEWLARRKLWQRPDFLMIDVAEAPAEAELIQGVLMREVRDGYPKWAHLLCPICREHIVIPLAGSKAWKIEVDLFRRPSVYPSIWQTGSCGAHFFVRSGHIRWCSD
jgi:Family of unknown function (DUF6527)